MAVYYYTTNVPDGVWRIKAVEVLVFNVATANINMVASVTVADKDLACATALVARPATGVPFVFVNGAMQHLGDLTADCYFSADGGVTARTLGTAGNIAANDRLYWNGSIAGYQLAATDKITLDYFYLS
jgi:hypothetical protein